jgi:hypothetical protein
MKIKINQQEMIIDSSKKSIIIVKTPDFLELVDKEENYKDVYFITLPILNKKLNSISAAKLTDMKFSINRNLGLCIIYKLIEVIDRYKIVMIYPNGVDGHGIDTLISFLNSYDDSMSDTKICLFLHELHVSMYEKEISIPIIR